MTASHFLGVAMTDLLLQTEQVSEVELHPQMNRPPSQAEENSSAKKVRPTQIVQLWSYLPSSTNVIVLSMKAIKWRFRVMFLHVYLLWRSRCWRELALRVTSAQINH